MVYFSTNCHTHRAVAECHEQVSFDTPSICCPFLRFLMTSCKQRMLIVHWFGPVCILDFFKMHVWFSVRCLLMPSFFLYALLDPEGTGRVPPETWHCTARRCLGFRCLAKADGFLDIRHLRHVLHPPSLRYKDGNPKSRRYAHVSGADAAAATYGFCDQHGIGVGAVDICPSEMTHHYTTSAHVACIESCHPDPD